MQYLPCLERQYRNESEHFYPSRRMNPSFLAHFPKAAESSILKMTAEHSVILHLARPRQSKWGDFKAMKNGSGTPSISVNSNLNPAAFLITFVHEWAHYVVWKKYNSTKAHGLEWKTAFVELIQPFLNESCFAPDLLPIVKTYFNNPSAAISSAPQLYHALTPASSDQVPVQEIRLGGHFSFRGKVYKRLEKRRTRFKCELVGQKRIYLFSQNALVEALVVEQ